MFASICSIADSWLSVTEESLVFIVFVPDGRVPVPEENWLVGMGVA